MKKLVFTLILSTMTFSLATLQPAKALTNPEYFVMRGRIIDKTLQPRQGLFDLRVSLWTDSDAEDKNPENIDQAFWNETHSLELGSGGEFELRVGTVRSLPRPFSFDSYEYLQVDARPGFENDYKILDPRPSDAQIDRIHLVTLPFKSGGSVAAENFSLNASGEISESMLPGSVKTLLSSLESRMTQVEEKIESVSQVQEGEVRYVVEEKEFRVFNGEDWNFVSSGGNADLTSNGYSYRELLHVHKNGKAKPGLFYWDANNKEYYVGMADGSLKSLLGDVPLPGRLQEKSWVDLRFDNLKDLHLETLGGVSLAQHDQFGLQIKTPGLDEWRYGVSFPRSVFDPQEHSTFEFVIYTRSLEGNMMMGLAEEDVLLKDFKKNSYFATRMGVVFQGDQIDNKIYGHDDKNDDWYHLYKRKAPWKADTYYRIKITSSEEEGGQNIVIDEVSHLDWDQVVANLSDFQTTHTLGTEGLKPFWALRGNSEYFLSGLRTY